MMALEFLQNFVQFSVDYTQIAPVCSKDYAETKFELKL